MIFKYDYLSDYEVDDFNITNTNGLKINVSQPINDEKAIFKIQDAKIDQKILNKYIKNAIRASDTKNRKNVSGYDEK